jgi:hypothetical protein
MERMRRAGLVLAFALAIVSAAAASPRLVLFEELSNTG